MVVHSNKWNQKWWYFANVNYYIVITNHRISTKQSIQQNQSSVTKWWAVYVLQILQTCAHLIIIEGETDAVDRIGQTNLCVNFITTYLLRTLMTASWAATSYCRLLLALSRDLFHMSFGLFQPTTDCVEMLLYNFIVLYKIKCN